MFFQLFDSFFYISLAITFGLISLMIFHFKNRIHTLEEKNQDLSELCQMMIKELQEIKQIQHAVAQQQQQHSVHIPNMMHRQQSQSQSQRHLEVVSGGSTPEPRESPVYQKITVIDNELEEEDDDDLDTEVIECEDDEDDHYSEDDEMYEEIEAVELDFDDESMENEEKIHFEMGSEQKNEMEEMMENMRKMDSSMYEDLATLLTEELRGSGVEGITGIQIISGGPENRIHVNHIPNSSEDSRVEELDENIVQVTDEIHSDSNSKTSDHITDLEDNLKKVEIDTVETEDIHVLKMPEEENISVITESEPRVSTNKKNPYAKMTVQMLRTAVISKGLMSDPSKVKKLQLVEMLTEHEAESTQDPTV